MNTENKNDIDEIEDDLFCEQLIEEYENSPDKGEFVSFEEAARICGVDIDELHN